MEIRLQDEADYRWKGRMDFVDNAIDTGSGTIRGRAVVDNPTDFLTPGMFGHMRLLGSRPLPGAAGARSGDGHRPDPPGGAMWSGRAGVVSDRLVELGPLSDGLRVIRSGLSRRATW